jgi:phosphate-selective porin
MQLLSQKFNLILFLTFVFLFCNSTAIAQHTDYVDDTQTQVLADSTKSYFIPDVSHKEMRWSKTRNKWFSAKLGFAPILDYNAIYQDNDSENQVGPQESRWDIRSARVMLRGKINFKKKWSYLLSYEYRGLDRKEYQAAFGFTDIKLIIPIGEHSELHVGKQKETFVYEMVGDAANLPHFERLLNPFFNSRNNGIIYRHFLMKDRMTISAGVFNQWPGNDKDLDEGATTFTARVTGLPKWENEGKTFMHMGIGVRYVEAENGVIRLKGKNESNISDNYVDTGNMEAKHQWNLNFEQLWSLENFSVLMEYVHNWTATTTSGLEQFSGFYVTGSYVLSGEQRPYDMKAAYARRIKPTGKYGAWEIVSRIGRNDLQTRTINGGINNRYNLGLNWWATQYWKAGLIYGVSNLDKNGVTGITNSLQFRLQWIY